MMRGFGICVVYILVAGFAGFTIPAYQAPDEDSHLRYIRYVTDTGGLPVMIDGDPRYLQGIEGFQPPLYYLSASIFGRLAGADVSAIRFDFQPFTEYRPEPGERYPFAPEYRAIHLIRLISVLCGAVGVIFIWLTAETVFSPVPGEEPWRRTARWVMPVIPLIHPQYIFQTSVVTNDSMLVMVSAIFFYFLARYMISGTVLFAVLMFGFAGTAVLVKTSGIILFIIAAAVIPYSNYRAGEKVLAGPVKLAAGLAAFIVITGWWFFWNLYYYGSPLAGDAMVSFAQKFVPRTDQMMTWNYILGTGLPNFLETFYGAFGWSTVLYARKIYLAALCAVTACSAGLILVVSQFIRARFEINNDDEIPAGDIVPGFLTVSLTAVLLACAAIIKYNFTVTSAQGRLLFVVLPAIYFLAAVGFAALARSTKNESIRRTVTGITIAGAAGVTVYTFFILLPALYAPVTWPVPLIQSYYPILESISPILTSLGL